MFLSIGKLARYLGVSVVTIRRWERLGKIKKAVRTFGNHRRFNLNDCMFKSIDTKQTVCYARVSSRDQIRDLNTQAQVLLDYCKSNQINDTLLLTDIGSGLNYKKSGLNKLLNLILNQKIQRLILNHKDRLLRFGSELIFKLCKHYEIEVIILNAKELDFKEKLCENVIELMTVFCATLYGSRAHKNKKALQQIDS